MGLHFRSRPLFAVAGAIVLTALPLVGLLAMRGPVDGAGDLTEGHWGAKTASVNWCEADYAVTPYIAEFWNTLSSLTIVCCGIFGMAMHARFAEPRFMWAFGIFTVVGLGSAAFHGTLWRSMQLLDELPMLWGNSVFIYILIAMEDDVKRAPRTFIILALALVTVVASVAVAVLDSETQDVFLLGYGGGVIFLLIRSFMFDQKYNSQGQVWLAETSVVFYLGGFTLWLLDRSFCPSVRSLYLHMFWHICAGTGTFTAVLLWMWVRYEFLGHRPRVRGATPFTRYIEIGEAQA